MTALYLTEPGTVVSLSNQTLVVKTPRYGERNLRLAELSLLVVFPGVQLTAPVLASLMDNALETLFLKQSGSFRGRLQSHAPSQPLLRLAQYRLLESQWGLEVARRFVLGKLRNQRTLLQQRQRQGCDVSEAVDAIWATIKQLETATSRDRDVIMGHEGMGARLYFGAFGRCLPVGWFFSKRTRQPPQDPVNALLSWGYGVLLARCFSACMQAQLDPYLGFLHALDPSRPNLVLDLMEEFRPVVVDRAVLAVLAQGILEQNDFEPSPDGDGIWLGDLSKRLFLGELHRTFKAPLLYEPQNRRLTLEAILLEQARWLARCLLSSSLEYQPFLLR